jgi:hypothetical protein
LTLSEGEGKDLHTGIEEHDLEGSLSHLTPLADELMEPRFGDRAVALLVDVDAPTAFPPRPDRAGRAGAEVIHLIRTF